MNPGRRTKAILWDNDGVLVDTERLYFRSNVQILAGVGVTLTKEMFVELFLVQGRGAWHLAAEKGISPSDIERLRGERNALYGALLEQESIVIDGVREVLGALDGKYVMGVVTSSRRDHFERIHRSTDLMHYFDFVITGDDCTMMKPNPEPYLLAVGRSGCSKEECLAVEDSERGMTAAKDAGIRCVVVPTALTRNSNFARADAKLESIKEVMREL